MKKLNSLAILAIAAIGLFACSKAEVPTPEDTESPETPAVVSTHTVTFEVGNPETKTAIVEHGSDPATYVWSASDADGIVIWENANIGTGVSMDFGSPANYSSATIRATFTDDESGSYVYKGFFSKGRSGGGEPLLYTTQTPAESSFDPNADILISKVTDAFNAPQSSVALKFKRVVVPNKMTLKGLTPGETISTVVVKGDKPLGGYYNYKGASVETPEGWYGSDNTITLNINREVPVSGELVVWFLTRPVDDVTLTVTANGSSTIYSKTFGSTISFELGSYTVFGVSSLTRTPNYSGDYVLINEETEKMAVAWETGDTYVNSEAIDYEAGIVYYNPDAINLSESKLTLAVVGSGLYSFVQNGKYLSAANTGNVFNGLASFNNDNSSWEVTNSEGNWTIRAVNSTNEAKILRYNSTYSRFACYASGQKAVTLVPIANVKPSPAIGLLGGTNLEADAAATADVDMGIAFNSATTSVAATIYDDSTCETAFTGDWLSVSADTDGATYSTLSNNSTGATRTAYVKIVATNANRSVNEVITIVQSYIGAVSSYYAPLESSDLSSAEFTSGRYIIVAGTNVANGSVPETNWGGYVPVSIVDNKITATAALEELEVTLSGDSENGYTVYFESLASPVYLTPYASASFNVAAKASATKFDFTTESILNHSNNSWNLRCNLAGSGKGYRWYSTTTGTAACLYKKVTPTP